MDKPVKEAKPSSKKEEEGKEEENGAAAGTLRKETGQPEKKHQETSQRPAFKAENANKNDAEIKELKGVIQRLQADFENYCKRIERQKREFVEFANTETIKEFLPLLDSFQAAIEKIEKHENISKKGALEGMLALQKQFLSILQKHGLREIKSIGEKFDPALHEAILKETKPEKADEEVLEELQKGFLLKGKLLRPAKVKINSRQ